MRQIRGSMKKNILIMDRDDAQIRRIAASVRVVAVQLGCRADIFGTSVLEEAGRIVGENDLDLLVTDVVLDEKEKEEYAGIAWTKQLRKCDRYAMLPIIFIASDEKPREYACREINCLGYLPRKFEESRLKRLLGKGMLNTTPREEERYVMIRTQGVIYPLRMKEILYAETINRILYIYRSDGTILQVAHKTLGNLQKELASRYMVQSSKSTLINSFCIDKVEHKDNSLVLLMGEVRLFVGKKYLEQIRQTITRIEPRYVLK